MTYEHTKSGTFLKRPNRFIAHVDIEGETVVCHVKNTGRCRELLIPQAAVVLEFHPDAAAAGRKTSYSLIGVYKETKQGKLLINMDSPLPNAAAAFWLKSHGSKELKGTVSEIRREVTYGQSRFDLAFQLDGQPAFMEIKGVTLEENGTAMFPDAPTERGVKHIRELIKAKKDGYDASILFVIQMKSISSFTPNSRTHPQFAEALKDARRAGVRILAYDCLVTEHSMEIDMEVPVIL